MGDREVWVSAPPPASQGLGIGASAKVNATGLRAGPAEPAQTLPSTIVAAEGRANL